MEQARAERQQYTEAFVEALSRLNDAQRQAVEQIEGPVMVVAGPGTGKTHILAARIGKILLDTDTDPQNILCLTFTEAGVLAMRERLLQFIGPEAHRVNISTFHSFCNSIIQDNLELFGRQDLEPITELEQIDLIRRLLDQHDASHPLKQAANDPYFYERHLLDLFQKMKRENWSAPLVLRCTQDYLEDLPNRSEFIYKRKQGRFRKGDLKEAAIIRETQRMEKLMAAARLFPDYEAAKQRTRRYDYDDMILWVLDAFEQHDFLLRSYQERFLYILVDEYQDTNGAQNEVIRQLISYWEVPNVFVVGDDDQSIYEFQGARLQNLVDFFEAYPEQMQLVLLRENYRSSQVILDHAAALIDHNELRIVEKLSVDKELQAATGQLRRPPEVREYPNPLQEMAGLLRHIRDRQAAGVPLHNIAVIYAQHRQAEDFIQLLEKEAIPYVTRRRIDVLQQQRVQQLRKFLQYFAHELQQPFSGEELLFEILHFDFLSILPADIARISLQQSARQRHERTPWRQLIGDEEKLGTLSLKQPQPLFRLAALLEELLGYAANIGPSRFTEYVINRTGLLQQVLNGPDKFGDIQILRSFLHFIIEEERRDATLSLPRFLELLRRMEANRLGLPLQYSVEVDSGLQLLTAHSAKGLEFEEVFLLDCSEEYWGPRAQNSRYTLRLPDTLILSGEEDAREARRRLFYVAMTRARSGLYFSYSRLNSSGKENQRVSFLHELVRSQQLPIEREGVPQKELLQLHLAELSESPVPRITPEDPAMIEAILQEFKLSISALNRYLDCPLSFYFEHILSVPSVMSGAGAYGTAVHNTLQRFFEQMKRSSPRNFAPFPRLAELFERELDRQRQYLPEPYFEQRRQVGLQHLRKLYQTKLGQWEKNVLLEYTIRATELKGVPLTGTIDKIEFLPRQKVRIVDYKTGRMAKKKIKGPDEQQPYGGAFWRQLVFYKLLYEQFDKTGKSASSGRIAYVSPDEQGEFPQLELNYEVVDMQFMQDTVVDTYQKIRAQQFYEGCGADDCKWCNFVRQQQRPYSFHHPAIEDLDD